jgi:hypothetical protein
MVSHWCSVLCRKAAWLVRRRPTSRRELRGGMVGISFPQAAYVSVALRDRSYEDIYEHLVQERAYNAKFPV